MHAAASENDEGEDWKGNVGKKNFGQAHAKWVRGDCAVGDAHEGVAGAGGVST